MLPAPIRQHYLGLGDLRISVLKEGPGFFRVRITGFKIGSGEEVDHVDEWIAMQGDNHAWRLYTHAGQPCHADGRIV